MKMISRKQFPLVPAQALTSYKSQSSTYDKVLVFLSGMTRRHAYTACSRAKTLSSLFISGQYKKPPPPSKYDMAGPLIEKMRNEMHLHFELTFPHEQKKPYAVFHNVRSLNLYLPYVKSHFTYVNADILMFVETRFNNNETHDIPSHVCIHRNDCFLSERHAYGSAVYVKKETIDSVSIEFKHVDKIQSGNKLKGFLDLVAIRYNLKTIIFLHKSPNYPINIFKEYLRSILQKYTISDDVSVVGDFNVNYTTVNDVFENLHFKYTLIGDYSTDYYTLIDLFYSNQHTQDAFFYESPISDHKPIFFFL